MKYIAFKNKSKFFYNKDYKKSLVISKKCTGKTIMGLGWFSSLQLYCTISISLKIDV